MNKFIATFITCLWLFFLNGSAYALTKSDKRRQQAIPVTTIPKVVVIPNSTQETHTPTNSQVTVITEQQIKAMGASTIEQALLGQPGIQLQDLTGDGSQVSISMRGFGGNAAENTLILLDGVPLNNPDLGTPDFNSIPIEDVKKIEIMQGSEGVLLGDQAVGGVINIITKKPQRHHMHVTGSYGSYHYKKISASVTDQFKIGLGYLLTVNKLTTDNYREHNNDDQENIFGEADYHYHSGVISINYFFNHRHLLFAGALTAKQVRENRRQAQNALNFSNQNESFFHITQEQWLGENWRLITNISNQNEHDQGVLFSPFKEDRDVLYIDPKLIGLLGNMLVTYGLDAGFDQFDLFSSINTSSDKQTTQSAYIQTRLPLLHVLTFFAGARAAQMYNSLKTLTMRQAMHNRAIITSFGASLHLASWWNIFVRRAGSYRFPKADENAFVPIGVNALRTQTGISYELGTRFYQQKWRTKLMIYQLNLKNEIAFDPTQTPQQPFGANRNLAPTSRTGFIAQTSYFLMPSWLIGGQYTHVNAHFSSGTNIGKQIPFVASDIFHLFTNIALTTHLNFYAEAVYTGSRYPAGDDANIAAKERPFTVINVNLNYQFKHFYAGFRINNLFNKLYNSFSSCQPFNQQVFFYPGPGRNFLITMGYHFYG